MKKLKYFLTIGCLAIMTMLSGIRVHAQSPEWIAQLKSATPQERAVMQTDLMKSKLLLNERQYRETFCVNRKYAFQAAPILQSDDNKFSKYLQIKSLLAKKDGELKKIFDKQQFAKYQEIEQQLIASIH